VRKMLPTTSARNGGLVLVVIGSLPRQNLVARTQATGGHFVNSKI